MRVLQGEVGRWLSFEWLPPFLLVALIVPLSHFWPEPPATAFDAVVRVLSAGDLLAIDLCLILSAASSLMERITHSSGKPPDYAYVFQAILLSFVACIVYAVLKTFPAESHAYSGYANLYALVTLGISVWTCLLIFVRKLQE